MRGEENYFFVLFYCVFVEIFFAYLQSPFCVNFIEAA